MRAVGVLLAVGMPALAQQRAETFRVGAVCEGMDPAAIERTVCVPLELALAKLQGVESIRSACGVGRAALVCVVRRQDAATALREVVDAVDLAPDGVALTVSRLAGELAVSGVMTAALTDEVAARVREHFEVVAGVHEVRVDGAVPWASEIRLSSTALAERGISAVAVADVIQRELPGAAIDEFAEVVVGVRDGTVVRLRDVATIALVELEPHRRVHLDRRSVLLVRIYAEPSADVAAVRERVESRLAELPAGVEWEPIDLGAAHHVRWTGPAPLADALEAWREQRTKDGARAVLTIEGARDQQLGVSLPELAEGFAWSDTAPATGLPGLQPLGGDRALAARLAGDVRALDEAAAVLSKAARGLAGVISTATDRLPVRRVVRFELDRGRLAEVGLSAVAVARTARWFGVGERLALGGATAVLRIDAPTALWWENAFIVSSAGDRVPLQAVGSVTTTAEPRVIRRVDGQRAVTVRLGLSDEADEVALRGKLAAIRRQLPRGVWLTIE